MTLSLTKNFVLCYSINYSYIIYLSLNSLVSKYNENPRMSGFRRVGTSRDKS